VNQKLISVREAAKLLRIHRITLYRMLDKGQIPGAFKVGRVWRLDLEEMQRFFGTKLPSE
jgi:excisionase family DNA binding protein